MLKHTRVFVGWLHAKATHATAAARALAQSMVEYAIIAALVAVVAVIAVRTLGNNVATIFTNVNSCMSNVAQTAGSPGGGGSGSGSTTTC